MIGASKIFVSIASYRDSDCKNTIADLFEQAANPDRVFIGVCYQYEENIDEEESSIRQIRPNQIRTDLQKAIDSKGACWARSRVQNLWIDEEYYFQIDSHMRFEKGWDDLLIEMLNLCPSEKAVISTYPPGFTPPRNLEAPQLSKVAARDFNVNGIPTLHSVPIPFSEVPSKSFCIAAGFIFAKSSLIKEVPYDPLLYFEGEEITLAIRMWINGWDIYSPNVVVCYHYYNQPNSKIRRLHWEDNKDWYLLEQVSRSRVLDLLNSNVEGSNRSLQEYEKASGINFKTKTVTIGE